MIDASATSPFVNGQNALLKAYAEDHWSETNPDPHALWPRCRMWLKVIIASRVAGF